MRRRTGIKQEDHGKPCPSCGGIDIDTETATCRGCQCSLPDGSFDKRAAIKTGRASTRAMSTQRQMRVSTWAQHSMTGSDEKP